MNVFVDDLDMPQSKITKAKKIVEKALPYLKKEYVFPKDVEIRLQHRDRNEDGNLCLGEVYKYADGGYACILNLNNEGFSLVDTLGHEFTHIEQMYQCRLAQSAQCYHWMNENKEIVRVNKATSFEEYRNYPWEIEARMRGREFKNNYRALIDPTIKDRIKKFFGLN